MHSVASVKDISVHGKTHSKGGGILHTVHDNLLVGPDAVETVEKENTETRAESIKPSSTSRLKQCRRCQNVI